MAYWLPRMIILLIAWGTTGLMINIFTSIDPLVFYLAGGMWSVVSLSSFSYLDKLWPEEGTLPVALLLRYRRPAE
jgi:hypothetical protein